MGNALKICAESSLHIPKHLQGALALSSDASYCCSQDSFSHWLWRHHIVVSLAVMYLRVRSQFHDDITCILAFLMTENGIVSSRSYVPHTPFLLILPLAVIGTSNIEMARYFIQLSPTCCCLLHVWSPHDIACILAFLMEN